MQTAYRTRCIFVFTRALCLGETLVLLDVVSQGLFGNVRSYLFFHFYAKVQRSVTYGIYCYITTNLTTRKRDSYLQHVEVLYWAACD